MTQAKIIAKTKPPASTTVVDTSKIHREIEDDASKIDSNDMIKMEITSLLTLDIHECFMFFGEPIICLIVAIDDGYLFYYREDSDHLFKIKREHKHDVFYLHDAPKQ